MLTLEAPMPEAPKQPTMPEEKLPEVEQPLTAMGKFLPMIAILGGGLSKKASMGALQAAVGAMEGQKQGNLEARDRAHQEWLDHMKTLSDNYSLKRDAFSDAMSLYEKDQAKANVALDIFTQQHGLTVANMALRRGDTKAAIDLIKAGLTAEGKMEAVYQRSVMNPTLYSGPNGETLKADPGGRGFVTVDGAHYSGPTNGITKVGAAPRSANMALLNDFKTEYRASHGGQEPSFLEEAKALAQSGALTAATKAYATGKQGQQVQSLNAAVQHLKMFDDLADALQNNDVRAINSMSNFFKREFGQPAPTDFNLAKHIVADEVVKAVVATGGGVTDRDSMQKQFDAANSPAALKSAVDTARRLMAGQARAHQKTYERTTKEADFSNLLLPDTIEAMKKEGFDLDGASGGQTEQAKAETSGKWRPVTDQEFNTLKADKHAAYLQGKRIVWWDNQWKFADNGQPVPQ
jgi:hypothetical protein